jgi:uncharacterized membrane protein YbhN (UPF0104 family)
MSHTGEAASRDEPAHADATEVVSGNASGTRPARTSNDPSGSRASVPAATGSRGALVVDAGWRARTSTEVREWLSGHHRRATRRRVLVSVLFGMALAAAALAGDGWVAGFAAVGRLTAHADWQWLPVAVGCVAVSQAGYTLAYRGVLRSDGGPAVSLRRMGVPVLAGFGLLSPRAGFALDREVCRDYGLSDAEARGRVLILGMLEYALLAPAAFVCAVVLFLERFPAGDGVLASWLIGVPAGTAIVIGLCIWRDRLPVHGRIGGLIRRVLDSVVAMLSAVAADRNGLVAVAGMATYWAADITALGVCLAIVHHAVPVDVLVVGYATGYALTRRSTPFAGAGGAEALMPFAMSWMTVPLAAGVFAVCAYRLCNLWLPLAPAALSLRHLRTHPPSRAIAT